MAIPYEKIVAEDLNTGYGSVSVTMPGGGSATGSKIGLHTFASGWLNVQDKGAIPGTDCTAAILSARDALAANGGGRLILPASSQDYLLSTRLDLTGQNIILIGDGANTYGNQITGLPASRLRWIGAAGGTMVYLGAVPGANNPQLRGAGIENVFFDCDLRANTAVEVRSAQNCWLKHLTVIDTLDTAIYIGVVTRSNGVGVGQGLAEQRNTQNCEFTDIWINNYNSDGKGFYLDGDSWVTPDVWSADTSLNQFRNLHVFTNQHECFYVACADSNYVEHSQFHRGDGGKAVVLDLPYGVGSSFDENNVFFKCTFYNGFEQKGGATNNTIYHFDRSQGFQAPTATTGLLNYLESPFGGAISPQPTSTWSFFARAFFATLSADVPAAGLVSSGLTATSRDTAGQAGLELYNSSAVFKAQLAYRNVSNPLYPGVVSLLANGTDIVLKGTADGAELPTTATAGYLCIPSCNGTPTGVPTVRTGLVPIVFDRSANKLWVYSGGAWVAV